MKVLADLWPLLLAAGCGLLVYAIVRLTRRFSPGSVSAGPKRPPDATNLGQSDLADDLRRIERRLDTRPASIIQRIERSCREVGVRTDGVIATDGGPVSPEEHIDVLLRRVEAYLELPPIMTTPTQPIDLATEPSSPNQEFTR